MPNLLRRSTNYPTLQMLLHGTGYQVEQIEPVLASMAFSQTNCGRIVSRPRSPFGSLCSSFGFKSAQLLNPFLPTLQLPPRLGQQRATRRVWRPDEAQKPSIAGAA